ncbi:FxSxx-COOH system tetratricopeptide repeat protein [Actinoplanes sp. NPDC051343]|uniref:FxSxx-COOH system tetratricopeptide repeat protein n=1 Tax=Actinoplanes sp. NPDC051343 TaxID=3363906 RepID=UPI0037B04423
MPGPNVVPAGPHRDLLVKLHELYGQAGRPATRTISKWINADRSGLLDTVSHETINATLRGRPVRSWSKLRSIVVMLCRHSEQPTDEQRELVDFNTIWVRIDWRESGRPELPSQPQEPPHEPPLPRIESPRRPAVAPRVTSRVHGELPERPALFTGREGVLDEIEARLRRSPETPLILYGPIGSGKTQVAAEYLRQHRDDYAITWWVQADDVESARRSLLRLAHELGVGTADNGRHPFEELFELLARSGPYLLVFDGVISGDIRTLIRTQGGNVLVATRNSGWARESPHDALEIVDLDESESSQLLRKQHPDMNPDQVARLIAVVGRSPLGLTEACRLLAERALSWEDLPDRLTDPANRLLTGPAGSASPAIENVRAIVRAWLTVGPGLMPLLTLLLGFGPSPIWRWMLQAGAAGDVSAGVRRVLGDPGGLSRGLNTLVATGVARGHVGGEWVEISAIVRLALRELVPEARAAANRRDVADILVMADPAHPEEWRTRDRHRAIAPHLRPAGLMDFFRASVYRTVHHQIRYLFLSGDLKGAQQLGRDAETALGGQNVLGRTDELVLQIRRDLANALRADGEYAEAYRLTEQAMERIGADPVYRPDHAIALDLARSRGHDVRIAGKYQEAYDVDQVTHRRHEAVFAENDLRRLASRYNLSVSARFLGRYRESAEADRAGLDRLQGDLGGNHRASRLKNALAEDLYGLGRYEEMVDLLAPLLDEEIGRELHRARRMTGVAFRRTGHLVPAVEQLGVCYQACLNQLGERRELTLAVGLSYANALRELGQFDTALHYCEKVADDYARAIGEDNPLVQAARVNAAAVHLAKGQAKAAEEILGSAHERLAEQVGDRHPFTVVAAVNRASAAAMSNPVSAWSWSGRAYSDARELFGEGHLDTLFAAAGFAADRVARHEEDGGAPTVDHILSTLRRRFGPGHLLVRRVADGSRMFLDIEPPSA